MLSEWQISSKKQITFTGWLQFATVLQTPWARLLFTFCTQWKSTKAVVMHTANYSTDAFPLCASKQAAVQQREWHIVMLGRICGLKWLFWGSGMRLNWQDKPGKYDERNHLGESKCTRSRRGIQRRNVSTTTIVSSVSLLPTLAAFIPSWQEGLFLAAFNVLPLC